MKQLFSELDNPNISGDENQVENDEDSNEEETASKHNNKEDTEDEKTRKINKKYNMDDYDDEGKTKNDAIFLRTKLTFKLK